MTAMCLQSTKVQETLFSELISSCQDLSPVILSQDHTCTVPHSDTCGAATHSLNVGAGNR